MGGRQILYTSRCVLFEGNPYKEHTQYPKMLVVFQLLIYNLILKMRDIRKTQNNKPSIKKKHGDLHYSQMSTSYKKKCYVTISDEKRIILNAIREFKLHPHWGT